MSVPKLTLQDVGQELQHRCQPAAKYLPQRGRLIEHKTHQGRLTVIASDIDTTNRNGYTPGSSNPRT